MPQTNIQRDDAIKFGSTKLEVGSSFESLVDLGALRSMQFNSKSETQEIAFDNTANIKKITNGNKASLTCQIAEIDMTTYEILNKGVVSITNNAGTLVSGASQAVASGAFGFNQFIEIENQNGDGSAITVNSVTGATDGALVADTDYYVGQNGSGKYGIFILDSATVSTMAQVFTIDYDYTPNANKTITLSESGVRTEQVARITNTNSEGNTFVIELTGVTNIVPTVLPFLADDADDVMTMEIELEGLVSQIIDSQSIA